MPIFVVAPDQAIVWNPGGEMVNVMIGNIGGEPVLPARQMQKTGALDRAGFVVPAAAIGGI